MKIAFCDNDNLCRKDIEKLLKEYSAANPQYEISFFIYDHADDLLSALKKTDGFDIYILDIIMPDTNGIELGVLIRDTDRDSKIIYLSDSMEFIFDAFKAHPFDYMIKPVSRDRFFSALDEAAESVRYKNEQSIIIKTCSGSMRLSLDRIIYAELSKNIIIYHLINGRSVKSITIRCSFAEAVSRLTADNRFVTCGTSLAVNLQHITALENDRLIFRDESSVHLSRKQMNEIRASWHSFV